MVELEDFIAETVTAIVRGIQKGQMDPEVGDHIAPLIQGEKRNDVGNFHLKGDDSNQATVLQFEVSVGAKTTEAKGGAGKAKARLFVIDFEVGGDTKGNVEATSVHKLKFAIPVKIPKRG